MTWKNQKPPSGIPARGDGYGGPAKRSPPREAFNAENQPSPEEKAAGHDVAKEVRDRIAARRFEITDRLIENAINGSEQGSNSAGQYLLNRLGGTPVASVDLTSGGKPMGYVIPAPAEIEDAEAWAKLHKGR